ncbi:MAG: hypothetical protein DRI34_13620 [Deltaproteobacteria bacterium]|nr:MAG: hypothetical protein DRI34_13620 [Deltaproteobacteria bacterium]
MIFPPGHHSRRRPSWFHVPAAALLLAGLFTPAGGCARAPLELDCTPVGAGELAVTEVRGPQGGADTWGQWIEIANTTGRALNLAGLTVNLRKLDGSGEHDLVVRDRQLVLDAGGYFVMGRFPADPGGLPGWVDWGYEDDFAGDLYSDAIIEVRSCGELVDRLVWRNLPGAGSWSYDGNLTPDAAGNDDDAAWCVDDTPAAVDDGGTQAGLPGTPREANHPCP